MGALAKNSALDYAEKYGWWVFPCKWQPGPDRKAPLGRLVPEGFKNASNDPRQIAAWWDEVPQALIGVATGASHLAVLDVNVKDPRKYGPDSLEELGHSILDNTWIVHTASGGWHCYYDPSGRDIPSSTHTLGPGLDVRASTGYVIATSPNSGYSWDPHYNPDTVALAPAPAWLIPPVPAAIAPAKPIKPCDGLSPYADAAIALACQNIRTAEGGQQRKTLLKEAFTIGTLAGAGGIPPAFARAALIDAGYGMPSYNPREPWTAKEIARQVNDAFNAGCGKPRPVERRAAR